MKRISFFAIIMAVCAISAQAQIEVKQNGQVTVETASTNTTTLRRGSYLDNTAGVTIGDVGRQTGLKVFKTASDTASTIGIHVNAQNPNYYNVGIHSISMGGISKNKANIGVRGESHGSWYATGVYGQATWSPGDSTSIHPSAGIYGSSTYLYNPSYYYSGHYAGYFNGNVRVGGGVLYATLVTPSYTNGGSSQSSNVTLLSAERGESVTDKLSQVGAIQFIRDKRDMSEATDEIPAEEKKRMVADGIDVDAIYEASRDAKPTLSSIQYGLIADQLKKVYPELVYEDKDGNVSINYIEMIPLLVQSINELSQKVATLEGGNAVKAKAQATAIEETSEDIDQVRMDQNKPNPFSGSTVITLNVPETVKQANIFIYDLSGKQIQSLPVTERGETDITVYASGLSAGMYIYTLVVDGQVKVTRRMIVSEK